MASQIDPTKPADGVPAAKAELRANLQAARDEVEALQSGKAEAVHSHALTDLEAGGTPDATTFLRGDGTWAAPPGGQISAVGHRTLDVGADRTLAATDKAFVVEGGDTLVVQQLLVRHAGDPTQPLTLTLPDSAAIAGAGAQWQFLVAADQTGEVRVRPETTAGGINGDDGSTGGIALAGAGASAVLIVDRNPGAAPTARLEGETAEARTVRGVVTFAAPVILQAGLDAGGQAIHNHALAEDEVSGAYTLVAADRGRLKRYTGAGHTWTVPALGPGEVLVENDGSGAITLAASGVTLSGATTIAAGRSATLRWFDAGTKVKALTAKADYESQVLAEGPVAYWPLRDTSATLTASVGPDAGAQGAAQRGRTPTIVADDVGGATTRLNGMHDWITAPHDAAMAVAEGAVFGHAQIDAWKERQVLFAKGASGASGDLRVELLWGKPRFVLRNSGGEQAIEGSFGDVPIETSFFWAASWGSAGMKLYIGTSAGSAPLLASNAGVTDGIGANSAVVNIGQLDGAGAFTTRLYGMIGHVAMLGSQPGDAAVAALSNPQSANIYDPAKSYRGQFIGQADIGGGGGNSVMDDTIVKFDFTAPRDANVTGMRMNLRQASDNTGYSNGNGGQYDIYLVEFDETTNQPGTAKVSGVNGKDAWAPGHTGISRYEYVAFDNNIPIVKGKRYALVMENVDPSPERDTGNYSSCNMTEFSNIGPTFVENHLDDNMARTPWAYKNVPQIWELTAGDTDLRQSYGGAGWFGLELDRTDFGAQTQWVCSATAYGGRLNGQGNFDIFGAGNMARLRFTPGYAADVDGIWVNAMRRSTSAGDLLIDLKEVGGATLETATVPASGLADIGADHGQLQLTPWSFVEFAVVHSLAQGTPYELLMRSPESTDSSNCCVMSPMRGWINAHPGQVMPPETWYRHGGISHQTTNGGSTWDPVLVSTVNDDTELEWGGLLLRCVP